MPKISAGAAAEEQNRGSRKGCSHLRDGHTDAKTRADRPASQTYLPTHHIWKVGRRTGVVTGVVRASRPPIFGWEVTPDHLLCTPDHLLRDPPCIPPSACVRRTDPSPFLLFSSPSLTFDKVSTRRNNPSSSKTPTRARFQGIRCTFLTSWAQLAREIVHLRAEIGSYMAVTARKIFRAAGGRQPTNQPHRCHLALSRTPLAPS